MTAQTPTPFPTDGQRKLNARELLERMDAQACLIPDKLPTQCESQMFVGVFFDGTGNNMKLDFEDPPPEKRKHTNVVKLYQAFPRFQDRGYFRIYLPGVGTPFPEIGDTNHPDTTSPNLGSISGEKGEHRILWALLQLLNAPHQYLRGEHTLLIPDDQAKTICHTLASSVNPASAMQRRLALNTWQQKLIQAMRGFKPRVTQINLSVFGFSRGAAEARVFVNWLMEVCDYKDGGWSLAGMALNVQFLGIFDTVASVGAANLLDEGTFAGHQGWADNTLQIHPAVRQCVHMVAGHELRACFPLDSVRIKGGYPANVKEVVYPGSHSDVGGGYAPGDLGACPTPNDQLCILPGRDMYEAARKAGVPLLEFNVELKKKNPDVHTSLTPSESLLKVYNAYLKACGVTNGPVESMLRQHMALMHGYRYKWRREFTQRRMAYANAAKPEHKDYLLGVQQRFMRSLGLGMVNMLQSNELPSTVAERFEAMQKAAGLQMTRHEQRAVEVAKAISPMRISAHIDNLFDWFVHDSLAGFISMRMDEYKYNRMGLAKFRTVFKGND